MRCAVALDLIAQEDHEMETFDIPHRLGRYRLIQRVAVGGMGEIFYASAQEQDGSLREFAIKRLHPENKEHPTFVKMFLNEGRISGLLKHPHVVQTYEFAQDGSELFMVMEWIDGPDLQHLLRLGQGQGRPISVAHAIEITMQALRALHYAHTIEIQGQPMHLTHRDISPHNLLLNRKGIVKVTDFGIARMADHLSLTATGVLKGKVPYMAPEQTRSSKVGPQADIFAMGVILWEMLCHRRLFSEPNDLRCIDLVRHAPIPWPNTLQPSVPEEVAEIVMWALQRDPQKRAPNADTLLHYLSVLAENLPPTEPLHEYIRSLDHPAPSLAGTQEIEHWHPPAPHTTTQCITLAEHDLPTNPANGDEMPFPFSHKKYS